MGLYLYVFLILTSVFSQEKTIALDIQKSRTVIEECKNIQKYQLIENAKKELLIKCQEDNLQFLSKQQEALYVDKLRIGTFNLLHPGTNKTLFKDFDLVAKLIHKEFDILTAVELVDVNSDTKTKNAKLIEQLMDKYKDINSTEEQISAQEKNIQQIENSYLQNDSRVEEFKELIRREKDKYLVATAQLKNIENDIISNNSRIEEFSKPKLIIFNKELFKKARLKKLKRYQDFHENLISSKTNKEREISIIADNIKKYESDLTQMKPGLTESAIRILDQERRKLSQLRNTYDLQYEAYTKISRFYQLGGYLKLLVSLRKINKNWSLVLAPHPEAALESSLQEYVGFYFRSDKTELDENIHCSNKQGKYSVACYPNFYSDYMGRDFSEIFSRRPFMATFKGRSNSFTIMGAHVVFDSSTDEVKMKKILKLAFNTENLSSLGTGITKTTYARFAEVKVSLKMLEKLKEEGLGHIIYTGDLNLEAQNNFFKKMIGDLKLLIEDKTSLSESRFTGGKETFGLASNYDHFIMTAQDYENCKNETSIDYVNGTFAAQIEEKYLVRKSSNIEPYEFYSNSSSKISDLKFELKNNLEILNTSFSNGTMTIDKKTVNDSLKDFEDRVIQSQRLDKTYYKFYSQVISDHLPIKIECSF